jgi:hemolysin III
MRGWLHLGMVPVALIAGLVLIITTDSLVGRLAEGIYLVTALMLFGNSASYHLGHWTPRVRQVFRRFDHSNIAIFIAGTYTPLAVLLLGGASRVVLLAVIWGLALAEVVLRNVWLAAPRWLYTLLYVAMGWAALFWLGQMVASGGLAVLILLLAGGLAYTAGALVYALKRPNISLRWFGFHELFHAGTIVGAGCHFAAIWLAAH